MKAHHLGAAVAATLVAAALLATQWDYVPLGDNAIYADCLLDHAASGRLVDLDCADHPTRGWLAPLALVVSGFGARPPALLLPNLLAFAVAAGVAAWLWARARPGAEGWTVAGAVALGAHPLLLVNLVMWSPDTGLALLSLPFLAALGHGRHLVAAALAVLLALTKETGWLMVGAGGMAALVSTRDPAERRRVLLVVAAGAATAVAWLLTRDPSAGLHPGTGKTGALWQGTDLDDVLSRLRTPEVPLRTLLALGVDATVLQFHWLLLPFVVLSLLERVPRALRGRGDAVDRVALGWLGFVLLLPVLAALPLTAGVRYVVYLVPGYVLLAVDGLAARAALAARLRPLLLVLTGLWGLSCFRTVDPVARLVFGTFSVGEHALLRMTRWSADWPGPGADQLAYNFQYLQLPRVIDLALADLRPSPDTVFLLPPGASWRVLHRLDPETGTRTWPSEGTVPARVIGEVLNPYDAVSGPVIGFAMPNAPEGDFAALMARWATPERMRRYEMDGYWIDVYVGTGTGAPPPR